MSVKTDELHCWQEVWKFVNEFNCSQKLITQIYDEEIMMVKHLNRVQTSIKVVFDVNVIFVYCYAHSLNLVISCSASSIHQYEIFFHTLKGILTFFSKSMAWIVLLDELVARWFLKLPKTCWTYSLTIIHFFSQNYCFLRYFQVY